MKIPIDGELWKILEKPHWTLIYQGLQGFRNK